MIKTTTRLNKHIKIILLLSMLVCSRHLLAQSGITIQWDKTFGGTGGESVRHLQQTSDGGYIFGGDSDSGAGDDKTETSRGNGDYWIVKTNAIGNKLWDKRFGGSGWEELHCIQQTNDGGYILGGYSYSGADGDKTEASRGDSDYWIVKTDLNGNKIWDKRFGGSGTDFLYSLQQTSDGGYILGGVSGSGADGDKTEPSRGLNDFWVVKIDAIGNKVWDKRFGGSDYESLFSLQQTSDGGYILGGMSASGIDGDRTQANWGTSSTGDYWVVKLNATGNKMWDKRFGGSGSDAMRSIKQTSDGGYILGGFTNSNLSGDKSELSRGHIDYWIVKINSVGTKLWDKCFGGDDEDRLLSLQQTNDGDYLLGGFSKSGATGDKTEASQGFYDYWIVKADGSGNKVWDMRFGGNGWEELNCIQQTSDGYYILGGGSTSGINGDKTEASKGSYDFWVVKLAPPTPLPVSWLYFNGKNRGNETELNWATASEMNSENFVVERSENGKNFEGIGTVKATGNSNHQLIYSFTDKNPLKIDITYYRLKQTDLDGKFAYSKIITVNKGKYGVLEAKVFPNPFNDVLHLQTSAPEKIRQVVLLSIDGNELYRKNINQTAEHKLTDLPVLNSGLYFLQLKGENSITTLKVNHQ